MEPMIVMSLIASGLGLVDQFYDLAKKIQGQSVRPHSVQAKPEEDKLVITDEGRVQEITASELQLGQFDQVRHDTLWTRLDINWRRYNGLDAQRATASADEKVRLEIQMEQLKSELCPDFKELVAMYQRTLNRGLPDHYSLHDVCS